MGHLNFEDVGKMLCKIGNKTLYISDKFLEDGFNDLKAKGDNTFQHIPDKDTERSILYITAPSGSGKSYYTRQYLEQYHKMYPKRDIFIFSALDSDTTLDKLKYLKRIKIKSPEFLDMDLTAQDFKDSLVVMDDVDCVSVKPIKLKIQSILTSVNNTGRHFNVSVIYTSHMATNGLETKNILNECHSITVFPKNFGGKSSKYLFENYLGLEKDEIKKIKNAKNSRWVTIVKTYPMVFFSATEAWCRTNV